MRKLFSSLITILFIIPWSLSAQDWKDVAHIFYNNCSSCHRPGEIGPFPLLSYHDASNPYYIYSIQSYVNQGLMPPWKADADYRHFLDERILTQAEKDLISGWIDAGTPAGDTTLAPPPPTFPSGSQLGTPDLVLSMTESFTIPGDGNDYYMCFVLPTNLATEQFVSAIEFRAGNGAAVHHVFLYHSDDSSAVYADQATPEYGYPSFGGAGDNVNADFLGLYAPGMVPRFYPASGAAKFTAGGFFIVQIHYAPLNYQTTDQSEVNIFFSTDANPRKVHAKRIGEGNITNPPFVIHSHEVDTFYSEYLSNKDYSLFAIAPHQHLLGRSYKIWAELPSQDSVPLIFIPKWDFNWQMLYSYPFLIHIPENSIIHAIAVYDNTVNNPDNPNNPPVNVFYGESSEDEMFKYFLNLLDYLPGDEFIVIDSNWFPTETSFLNSIISSPQLYPCLPNPASDQISFSYFLPSSQDAELFIYDISGKLIATPAIATSAGLHRAPFSITNFKPGLYFYTLKTKDKTITKSFIKQD